jgi:hypothetical protein
VAPFSVAPFLIERRFMGVAEGIGNFGFSPEIVEKDFDMATSTLDKGKRKEVEQFTTPSLLPHLQFDASASTGANDLLVNPKSADGLLDSMAKSTALASSASTTNSHGQLVSGLSARQIRKEDVLKRANERRQKIQEELNTVKRRLWETTIEQAALIHLTRKLDAGSDFVSDVEGNG